MCVRKEKSRVLLTLYFFFFFFFCFAESPFRQKKRLSLKKIKLGLTRIHIYKVNSREQCCTKLSGQLLKASKCHSSISYSYNYNLSVYFKVYFFIFIYFFCVCLCIYLRFFFSFVVCVYKKKMGCGNNCNFKKKNYI